MSAQLTKSQKLKRDETLVKADMITQHGAMMESIKEQRELLKESTKHKILTGPIEDFVARYMPFMNDKAELVDAVTKKLKIGKDKCLDEDGWIPIRKKTGLNEDQTFAAMVDIADAIYKKAGDHNQKLKDRRTTILECRPNQSMAGEVPGSSMLPDACAVATAATLPQVQARRPDVPRRQSPRLQAKGQEIFYGDIEEEKRNASDAVVLAEFKLLRYYATIADNEGKILGGCGYLLFNDPCRRFVFGFTIEDEMLRLWYFSRGHLAVSEGVNFHQDPHHLVSLLLFITFAPRAALGYDSTMKRVATEDVQGNKQIRYRYRVGKDRYETVGEPIYEDRCLDIATHGPRVWKVKKVLNADGGLADEVNVLKDYHLHDDAQTESEIQRDIFARLHQLDANNATLGNSTTYEEDAKPYFMTILADESVTLEDNTRDQTPPRLDNSWPYKYTTVEKTAADASAKGSSRTTGCDPNRDPGRRTKRTESNLKLQPRIHQRIVFKELCDTLYTLRDLQLYVGCLASVAKGLYFMRLAGYIHRDISPGNCLHINGRAIITDLEFAKPYARVSVHDPRTGTAEFMAVETQKGRYMFLGRANNYGGDDIEWFKCHYLHDIESVLWMLLWFIFHRIPVSLLHRVPDRLPGSLLAMFSERREDLFVCPTTGSDARDRLVQGSKLNGTWTLLEELYTTDPPFGFLPRAIFNLLHLYGDWCTEIESSTPLSVDGSLRYCEDVFKVEYHEKVYDALSDISARLLGPVPVRSVKEYDDELQRAEASKGKSADVQDVEEGRLRASKRKRDGEDDGAVAKVAEPVSKGSKRSRTSNSAKAMKSAKKTSNRSARKTSSKSNRKSKGSRKS